MKSTKRIVYVGKPHKIKTSKDCTVIIVTVKMFKKVLALF